MLIPCANSNYRQPELEPGQPLTDCVSAAGAYGVTANVGFLAMAYWRYSGREGKLRCWALSQVHIDTCL